MTEVYLLLGSNEGNRKGNLKKACKLIEFRCGKIMRPSSIYETEAWGMKEQNHFLNQALLIKTPLTPPNLLNTVKAIEKELGRTETIKWGPRIIDVDILFYEDKIVLLPELTIPHPFIQERKFTLVPLNEIATDFIHPAFKETVKQLLEECLDESEVTQK